ncbi:MAG: hypothetical protein OEY38_10160 [Gammaproteobacteria bacterium]|nr:hypothetical protein [Gammaproteobacteria bacterium]
MLYCTQIYRQALEKILTPYQMQLELVANEQAIPGSFWGESEAGLIADRLYVRNDTPVHSALHEACHYICMDQSRRNLLHTNAAGDYDEENAVCLLQILLADQSPLIGAARLMQDMDAWGYSFRLGNTQAWFEADAEDAWQWAIDHGLLDSNKQLTWHLRID